VQDPVTELWTVYREDDHVSALLGWWQLKGQLGSLNNYATNIQWAGFVSYQDNDSGPSMGSGHYAGERMNRAAYMADLQLFDKGGFKHDSPEIRELIQGVDRPDCYTAEAAYDRRGQDPVHKFYYGGPRGCRG
jgi:Neprosin